jgi:hypothetical protein
VNERGRRTEGIGNRANKSNFGAGKINRKTKRNSLIDRIRSQPARF